MNKNIIFIALVIAFAVVALVGPTITNNFPPHQTVKAEIVWLSIMFLLAAGMAALIFVETSK